jgi:glutathione S-transferase
MTQIVLIGPPQSSYVRTARMTCVEKGVPHVLEPPEMRGEAHARLHPWQKVPVLRHGDLQLYETSAIIRYIDEAFDGPRLTPTSPAARAVMEQWMSAINCYIYDETVRNYALQYIGARRRGEEPNREVIDAYLPRVERDFGLLDDAYARSTWIAGDSLSLADLMVGPIVQTVTMCPEGPAALARRPHLARAYEAIRGRESFRVAHEVLG